MRLPLLLFVSLVACHGAIVKIQDKCSYSDEKCLLGHAQAIFDELVMDGLPEYGLKAIEPFVVRDISLTITNGVRADIDKATVTGLRHCEFKKYKVDMDYGVMIHEIYCDVVNIEAEAILSGSNELLEKMTGASNVNGHGYAYVKLENVNIHFDLPFKPTRKSSGNIYLNFFIDKAKFNYEVGKVTVNFERVMIGEVDFSNLLNTYVSSDSRAVLRKLKEPLIDKVIEKYLYYFQRLNSESIPANDYLSEDLTPYANRCMMIDY